MGMESQNKFVDNNDEKFEVEGEVDLEEERINSLEDLRKYKRKSKSLKEQLLEYEGKQKTREKEVSKTIKES
jgi:hypothetical protein